MEIPKKENKMRSKLFYRFKKCQQWVYGKWGILFTTFITLVGFLFSIGNDYFSQFNYNHTDIRNDFCTSNHIAKFEEIVETHTNVPKHYFILDVSGSISERAKMQDMTADIRRRIEKIKSSGFADTKGFNFGVNDKSEKIEYKRLLQIHLMYSLRKLYEKNKTR